MQGIEDGGGVGVEGPDAGFGEVGVQFLEEGVELGVGGVLAAGGEDLADEGAPPELSLIHI